MVLCNYVIRICFEKQNFMYNLTKLGHGGRTVMMKVISEFSYSSKKTFLSKKYKKQISITTFSYEWICYLKNFLIFDCIFSGKN